MKKNFAAVLFLLCLCLTACGKEEKVVEQSSPVQTEVTDPADQVYEVKIDMQNLYDFFEYREYPIPYKDEQGEVTSMQIAYGLALRDVYTAANDSRYTDSLYLEFAGNLVVNKGNYTVDFDTMQVYGETMESYVQPVAESMKFWPRGDRTTIWSYGTYSSMYANYLEAFQITRAEGTVYLKYKYA